MPIPPDVEAEVWRRFIAGRPLDGASLRDSGLGGSGHERNAFRRVDFTRADLRGSLRSAAEMVGCTFAHAKLRKVDVAGTSIL